MTDRSLEGVLKAELSMGAGLQTQFVSRLVNAYSRVSNNVPEVQAQVRRSVVYLQQEHSDDEAAQLKYLEFTDVLCGSATVLSRIVDAAIESLPHIAQHNLSMEYMSKITANAKILVRGNEIPELPSFVGTLLSYITSDQNFAAVLEFVEGLQQTRCAWDYGIKRTTEMCEDVIPLLLQGTISGSDFIEVANGFENTGCMRHSSFSSAYKSLPLLVESRASAQNICDLVGLYGYFDPSKFSYKDEKEQAKNMRTRDLFKLVKFTVDLAEEIRIPIDDLVEFANAFRFSNDIHEKFNAMANTVYARAGLESRYQGLLVAAGSHLIFWNPGSDPVDLTDLIDLALLKYRDDGGKVDFMTVHHGKPLIVFQSRQYYPLDHPRFQLGGLSWGVGKIVCSHNGQLYYLKDRSGDDIDAQIVRKGEREHLFRKVDNHTEFLVSFRGDVHYLNRSSGYGVNNANTRKFIGSVDGQVHAVCVNDDELVIYATRRDDQKLEAANSENSENLDFRHSYPKIYSSVRVVEQKCTHAAAVNGRIFHSLANSVYDSNNGEPVLELNSKVRGMIPVTEFMGRMFDLWIENILVHGARRTDYGIYEETII